MGNIRRVVLIALIAFVGFMIFHAARPWGWSAQTEPPAGVPVHTISFTCGPLWGSGYMHGPPSTAYPISGAPCGERHTYQTLIGVDVLLGLLGIAAVALWGRWQTGPTATRTTD